MKKFFQRIDQSKGDSTHSHSHSSSFIGKTFVVGKHTVTIEDTIAEGGFALVFLAKGNGGMKYALKRMYVNTEQDLQVAWNEINIAKSLNGPRTVVGYIDSCVNPTGKGIYEVLLLMTYCKKHLLHLMNDKINTGLLEPEILKIFCDVCDAVSRLHHSNPPIVHRDLKVENILINSDNDFLLCDFGSATQHVLRGSVDGISNIEDEIQKYTTLSYRAPEMVDLYLDKPINHKADIWALGCLLYKLCFFTLPFGESPLAITSGNFSIPDNCKYSKYLQDLIRYMLEPDPNQRPDIYQVSTIAFQLANLENSVANLHNSHTPSLDQLSQLIKDKEQQISIKISRLPTGPVIESTSVAPRQRPKGSQSTGVIGVPGVRALPLPVQSVPGKRVNLGPSPDVTTQEEHQQDFHQHAPVVDETTDVAAPFPPSDLFGSNTFPIQPFGSPDSETQQQNLEVEAKKLFPPAGYGDPFQEESACHDTPNPDYDPTASRVATTRDAGGASSEHLSNYGDHCQQSTTFQNTAMNPATNESLSQGQSYKNHRRNVSDSLAFDKTFVNETKQFLAPFESSISASQPEVPMHQPLPESVSESQLSQKTDVASNNAGTTNWNPFNDPQPFSQMSEDHIFGAEFDKIRQCSHSGSENSIKVIKEEDPFGAAPFSYSGRRSKSVSKQSDRVIKSSTSDTLIVSNSSSPPPQAKVPDDPEIFCDDCPNEALGMEEVPGEPFHQQFVWPPLEDRSKYEKLQNFNDEESDDDDDSQVVKGSSKLSYPKKYLKTNRSKQKCKIRDNASPKSNPTEDSSVAGKSFFQDEIPPPLADNDQSNPSGGVFECNVSEDDSIGSASDLKDRINEECDYYYCDRGDASETIGSSVYHAECESVTTHEEEAGAPRIESSGVKQEGSNLETGAKVIKPHRGPKPSRAVLRARAKALRDLENKKIIEDRLLGHEFGDKPLLQDDELDSEEEEKDGSKEATIGSLKQHFTLNKSFRKMTAEDNKRKELNADVFASAPFKIKGDDAHPYSSFKNAIHSCSSSISPLDINTTGIVSPPAGFKSPEKGSLRSPDYKETHEISRIPLQSDVIFEEFPIYENVTLNEGNPLSSDILHRDDMMTPGLSALLNKNPFLNPFLNEDVADTVDVADVVADSQNYIPSMVMSSSLIETPISTLIPNSELSQIFESTPSITYAGGQSSSVPLMPTDIFGSTPFSKMKNTAPSDHTYGDIPREPMPDLLTSTEGATTQGKQYHTVTQFFSPTNQRNPNYIPLNSTPIKGGKYSGGTVALDPPPCLPRRIPRDEDLFGSVPFNVNGQKQQRSLARNAKSQTLPANMSSIMHSQITQIVTDEDSSYKVPFVDKKSTPPGFRKSRLGHQMLSESESSSEEDSLAISTRKPIIRDKSKDRLKYRNIGDEFEDENLMVLPNKLLKKEKDKSSKKPKKLDKHDKRMDKKQEKHEKRSDKIDKTDKKVDKLKEKLDKRNQETSGIANMSFEDFSIDDARRNQMEALALQSPEEDSELRTTGGTRFGSLKRGMNPFTKLGR